MVKYLPRKSSADACRPIWVSDKITPDAKEDTNLKKKNEIKYKF